MRQKSKPKRQPLKVFRAFGFEATQRPPNAKYSEEGPKTRIDCSFRDKDGAFKTTAFVLPEKPAAQME